MSTEQEKRQSERFTVHRGSVACINGQQAYSTLTDISESGVAFICSPHLQHGDQVKMALELKEGDQVKTFHVIVEVVRCIQEEFEHYVGAIVKTVTDEFKTLVEQVKFSRSKYGLA